MRDESCGRVVALVRRAARIAFMFLVMNSCAVAALPAMAFGKKVWRS